MPSYSAPLRDMRFVLYELMNGQKLSGLPGYEEFTPELIDALRWRTRHIPPQGIERNRDRPVPIIGWRDATARQFASAL